MRSMHVTDALSAYVDHALDEAERAAVEGHLDTCAECRRHLSALRDLVMTLRSVEPEAAPDGFRAQVRSRVAEIGAGHGATRWWPGLPMSWRILGAAAAVLVIGIFAANLLRTAGPVAMQETREPALSDRQAGPRGQLRSGADQSNLEAEPAPKAQRTVLPQRPRLTRRLIVVALPIVVLGGLAWMVYQRSESARRRRR